MLETVDLDARITKEEYAERKDKLAERLMVLQQKCIREKLPVVVCVDGWAASGKGSTISKLVKDLDPRAFRVFAMTDPTEHDRRYPIMTRYWKRIGQYGTMTIFDKSWYTEFVKTLVNSYDSIKKKTTRRPHPSLRDIEDYVVSAEDGTAALYAESAQMMERQLIDDGYLIVKCFFHVSKQHQKERLERLESSKSTAWRVTKADWKQNKHYDDYYPVVDYLLGRTNTADGQWHLIPADNHRVRRIAFMEALADDMEAALERHQQREEHPVEIPDGYPLPSSRFKLAKMPRVQDIRTDLKLDDDVYKSELDKEQERLSHLQGELYRRGIPTMIAFEGWDAAGKGGAIKRIAAALDARDYRVVPSSAPTPPEKQHPFLWRYWINLPKSGHTCIYDRSWYGRVMVERIEGFCTPAEWRRAYEEINDFEWEMYRTGTLLLKFWINVSPEEQLTRFEARKNDPDKSWKLTDEDWRNREKYPQYCESINDMFRLTSTDFAPWHIVESDDKKYARVKVLKTVNEAIEERLKLKTPKSPKRR